MDLLPRQKKRKRVGLLIAACVAGAFALWYEWMSYSTAKTVRVERQVRDVLNAGLAEVVNQAPRSVWDVNGGPSFYAADLGDTKILLVQQQKIYDNLLEYLQGENFPACKATPVVLNFTAIPEITATTQVTFELAPGVYRTIVVAQTARSPLFRSATGDSVA